MEKLLTIQQILPVNERDYVDRQGQKNIFVSRGLIVTDGVDSIYAELIGDNARRTDIAEGVTAMMQMVCTARKWEDKNHNARYSNEITINKIGL